MEAWRVQCRNVRTGEVRTLHDCFVFRRRIQARILAWVFNQTIRLPGYEYEWVGVWQEVEDG